MTTGSNVSDYTQNLPIKRFPWGTVIDNGRYGSYASRVWSGSDSSPTPKTRYEKQFESIPVFSKGKPARTVQVTLWEKKKVPVFVKDRGWIQKVVRVKRTRPKILPAVPPRMTGYRLRYRRVQDPKPPRVVRPEHPYTSEVVRWTDSGDCVSSRRNWPYPDTDESRQYVVAPMFWFNGYSPGYSNPWDSNDELALLGKLRNKVAGSDFNFAVFLAESQQSLRMIANAASRIDKSLRHLKKGNLQKAWKALSDDKTPRGLSPRKETSANWLEMQYGWLPLLQDAEGGAQFIAHLASGGSPQVARVRKQKPLKCSMTGSVPGSWRPLGFQGTHGVSVKAIFKDVSEIGLSGLLDPLSVAWEKLPYSFVVDWFIPIGNYLAARGLAASLQGTFVVTRYTELKWAGYTFDRLPPDLDPYESAFQPGGASYRSVQVVRTVSTSLDVPLPAVKSLAQASSWRHTANAVALLSQAHR